MDDQVVMDCKCDELLLIVKDEDTGEKVERRMPPPPGHDCEYVRRRNAMIPVAWHVAGQKTTTYEDRCRVFFEEMDRLVAELYKTEAHMKRVDVAAKIG